MIAAEPLPLKLLSPEYKAAMVCVPAVKVVVNVAATGEEPFSIPVPILTPPSRKITVPVGVLGQCELTVAVNVTACPKTEASSDDPMLVVVSAFGQTMVIAPPWLVSIFPVCCKWQI